MKVSRCFNPETFDEIKTRELHLFSDALRQGYSAVAYLRSVDVNGRIHVAFGIERTQPPCCINNKHFQTFESNRLMIIHSESYPKEWGYVNRDENPADNGSKELKLDAILKDDRWIRGPQFLGKDESS